MLKKFRFYFSLHFPIRYYLRRDIKYFAKKYKFEGKIIDFGCGQKPYEHLFGNSEYFGIDFKDYSRSRDFPEKKPDYYFDEKYLKDFLLPFENESFDNAVSFQVLEHHLEPEKMTAELVRVTKRGGFILITCPFVYALHEETRDYQRLTHYKLKDLFEKNNCEIIKIKKQGSLFSAVLMLASEQLNCFAAKNRLNYSIACLVLPFLLLFQYASLLADFFAGPEKVFINYAVLVRKK